MSVQQRRFQIHLSTLLILAVLGSVMLIPFVEGYRGEFKESEEIVYDRIDYWKHNVAEMWYYPPLCLFWLLIAGWISEKYIGQTKNSTTFRLMSFQVHLSTAIGLMFVAAVFLWINFTPYVEAPAALAPHRASPDYYYGWPMRAHRFNAGGAVFQSWRVEGVIVDILTGTLVLCCVLQISEYLIRRRKARK